MTEWVFEKWCVEVGVGVVFCGCVAGVGVLVCRGVCGGCESRGCVC